MHGQYIRDGIAEAIDQSCIQSKNNPYGYFNDKNAILLNCKDPKLFNEVYEKTI